jgi:hypothetical protein
MTQPTATLFAGALDNLMRHALTGCAHSAHHAAYLLDKLADRFDVDSETKCLCGRMSEALVDSHAES